VLNFKTSVERLNKELVNKLFEGFEIKLENFGKKVFFYSPGFKYYEVEDFSVKNSPRFVDISVTGKFCELMCDHCAGKILWHMIPAETPEKLLKTCRSLKEKGISGVLISGGSDKRGFVPLQNFFGTMKILKEELNLTVTCHVGLVDEDYVAGLKQAGVDAVLLDVIGDNETIASVYKLPFRKTEDYQKSLELLKSADLKVVPHIVIGLHYGKIKGEFKAIDMIAKVGVDALVLVAIMPYYGKSNFQLIKPPSPEESAEIFLYARKKLPHTPIVIGCARPAGQERERFDIYALIAGVNGITFPAEGVYTLAKNMSLEPVISTNCCSAVSFALSI